MKITSYCKECKKEHITNETWYNRMIAIDIHKIQAAAHFFKEHKGQKVKLIFAIFAECLLIVPKFLMQIVSWLIELLASLFEVISDFLYDASSAIYRFCEKITL